MSYALTIWALGTHPEIEIEQARHSGIKQAEAVQIAALQIEEKFDLVITNYEEFESALITLATRHMIRRDLPWRRMSADRLMLSRRLANLLSTCRLYIDQVTRDLSSPPFHIHADEVKKILSERYDRTLGYRVMESLRNQMQHRSIPTTGLSYSAARDNDLFAYRIDLALNLDVLSSGAFKASVLGELRALRKEEVDLILFVREYVQELASAQDVIRTLLEEDVAKADSVIDTAMSEWSAAGYDLSGLVAAECRADGTMHDEIHITNNMMERRVDLASANRSFMHLSRRYVTSARPSRAYARGGERSREAK